MTPAAVHVPANETIMSLLCPTMFVRVICFVRRIVSARRSPLLLVLLGGWLLRNGLSEANLLAAEKAQPGGMGV